MGLLSPKRKKRVLFACVENSCRSQMAEAFARRFGKDVLEAWSAGSKPAGSVDETAIRTMMERDLDLSVHRSKGLSDLPDVRWDYVITMGCGDECPFLLAKRRIDWDLPDPKGQPIERFRRVRDEIETRVIQLIHRIIAENI